MVWKAKKLAVAAGGDVLKSHKILCWFVLVGWAIYPIGYMMGTEGWYSSFMPSGGILMLLTTLLMRSIRLGSVLLYTL